jgi:DNA primase
MAGRIPRAFIDDLIARTDLVELVGSRVALKRAGREYKANCPFHNEKTPSFWVNPAKQFYHCFGCGAHGTAIDFLMNYDRLSFVEAVEDLAQRLGVDVPREAGTAGATPSVSEDLYSLMAKVATFYAEQLARDQRARAYATKRGLDQEAIERFAIGYAPDSWNEVLKRFGARAQSRQMLLDAGLVIAREKGDGFYDRFRDRLMFPIRDARGRVIAFGGRVLDQGEPKYLNSPETTLFHKGRELYGLYEVRQQRAPLTRLMVVEGYMDVVRLHQAGIGYAVATLGTSTTPEHLKRVFRLVREVVFCFDGDRAGRAAAWRALQNVLPEAQEGREMKFLFLPEGEDPDSLVGSEGREAFEARLDEAMPLSTYLVSHLGETVDLTAADGKARFVAEARPLLARIPPGAYLELVIEELARAIQVTPQRFKEIWRGGSGSRAAAAGTTGRAASSRPVPARPAAGVTARSAGRGGLVRQAVKILLDFPSLAPTVGTADRAALAELDEPGVDVLRELLDGLTARPATTTAQVLERWREHPYAERLARLAAEDSILKQETEAAAELVNALRKLSQAVTQAELDALIAADRERVLTPAERARLVQLLQAAHRG